MKRHPVILGFLLLAVIGLSFFLILRILVGSGLRGQDFSFSDKDKIGVVLIEGVLSNAKDTVKELDVYEKDNDVKAVVLRINSPGGAVVPSQEIYDKVVRLKQSKKVVVSMGSVAASGGYYIACAADRIIANPGTITGSIGVIAQFSQIEDLLEKIGLKATVIKTGKYKDVGSPVREMTTADRTLIQGVIDDIKSQFLEAVVSNRNISNENIELIADARIFTGKQALGIGLVDDLGNMDYAIDIATNLAGIEGKPEIVYPEEKRKSLLRYIVSETIVAILAEFSEPGTGISYLYKPACGI
ncbi:MAG TPA: signal peptide peptidase SppA [Syntrophales bacterium]|nr:signal peptide peptidase SppA [Syntrophales bacterium]HPQ44807.1 signal peptide peptidase SppA [Syntrophales bacterium]